MKIIAWLHIALGGLITFACLGMGDFFLFIGHAMQQGGFGANPNQSDRFGNTPITVAQERKRADVVAILRQAGAKK